MQGLCRLSTNGNLLVLFCLKTYIHISFCPKLSPTIICYTFEPFLFIFCCCFFFFFFTVFKSACYNETVVWSALLGLGKMREKSVVNQLQFAKDQQLQLNRGMNYTLQSLQIIWYILVLLIDKVHAHLIHSDFCNWYLPPPTQKVSFSTFNGTLFLMKIKKFLWKSKLEALI